MNLSLNQKLATGAFALSFLAMTVSLIIPKKKSNSEADIHYVSVIELADGIRNRDELSLYDLRPDSEFVQFHIPTASSVSLTDLMHIRSDNKKNIILYSGDDSLAIQGYFILKGLELSPASVLKGGIHDWYERLLYPQLPVHIEPEDQKLAGRIKELSQFFGGRPGRSEESNILNYYRDQDTEEPKASGRKPLVRMGC